MRSNLTPHYGQNRKWDIVFFSRCFRSLYFTGQGVWKKKNGHTNAFCTLMLCEKANTGTCQRGSGRGARTLLGGCGTNARSPRRLMFAASSQHLRHKNGFQGPQDSRRSLLTLPKLNKPSCVSRSQWRQQGGPGPSWTFGPYTQVNSWCYQAQGEMLLCQYVMST